MSIRVNIYMKTYAKIGKQLLLLMDIVSFDTIFTSVYILLKGLSQTIYIP
jgi:hypothetical protein